MTDDEAEAECVRIYGTSWKEIIERCTAQWDEICAARKAFFEAYDAGRDCTAELDRWDRAFKAAGYGRRDEGMANG